MTTDKQSTALQQLNKWLIDKWSDPGKLISCVEVSDKIDELLKVERDQIIDARISVTGLNHASPTDDNNLKDAEDYYANKYQSPINL